MAAIKQMTISSIRAFIITILILAAALIQLPHKACASEDPVRKKVLVVHSYHKTQKGHVVEMTQGIEEALEKSETRIQFFHMDTKRKNTVSQKKQAGLMASRKLEEFKPDIVITMDDNAQEYFAKKYAGLPGAPIFVFGGVNAEPDKYGFPAENITGVTERPNIQESIKLLLKISPGVKNMVVLSDKSPTTDPFHAYMKTLDLPVTILEYFQPLTFPQWKDAIRKYSGKTDSFGIYVSRTIRRSDSDPTTVPDKELIGWLNENTDVPTVGFFDSAGRTGVLCGISVSMKEQGYAAGKIALDILSGKKPSDFKVGPTTRGRIFLNLATAEKLGIEIRYNIISRAEEVIR